ncbi:3-deoxy-manno-octulosonate cytidylyltransferase [Fluviispira multicolorata]|uniref:3-deoxy-manno-octulosonate cytidylyltransferase n=1 Tax=Fluviispira multicolorata TaxID=2654512 RepID=A0A833N508_9BACT|nr:3-deoxy-manno-octulosonate cytidylyltransferase [Fluviispira multicolorata]KAB8029717.1 3-deoxy-manno-octulosonate cytidylyltransferase [Fluviispira multicolorata]
MLNSNNKNSVYIVIPARFASTRLPGKPLLKIGKHSMIARVIQQAQLFLNRLSQNNLIKDVHLVVATDHEEILSEAKKLNAIAVLTDSNLKNGTERVYSALKKIHNEKPISNQDIILNIQGDEPFFSIDDVENLIIQMLHKSEISMGTLAFKRKNTQMFFESSVVKVVCDKNQNALYFSRSPIPYPKELLGASGNSWLENIKDIKKEITFLHHVGVYAFRFQTICQFVENLLNSELEFLESLEQLRALEAGWKIYVSEAQNEPFGIDTPEDLEKAQIIAQKLD